MCKVLMNYDETREMTLEDLLEFMNELARRQHSQYDIPVRFYYEKLSQKIRDTVISNEENKLIFFSDTSILLTEKLKSRCNKINISIFLQILTLKKNHLQKLISILRKRKRNTN